MLICHNLPECVLSVQCVALQQKFKTKRIHFRLTPTNNHTVQTVARLPGAVKPDVPLSSTSAKNTPWSWSAGLTSQSVMVWYLQFENTLICKTKGFHGNSLVASWTSPAEAVPLSWAQIFLFSTVRVIEKSLSPNIFRNPSLSNSWIIGSLLSLFDLFKRSSLDVIIITLRGEESGTHRGALREYWGGGSLVDNYTIVKGGQGLQTLDTCSWLLFLT